MIAIKRVVSTSFWEDSKVIENFTPEDKYFMLYLLTNPHTTQIGIYQVSVKQMAWETGYSTDSIKSLIERFVKVHKVILYSKDTNEIAIKNYLCYAVVKGGKPVLDCLERDLKQVKNKSLFNEILINLKDRTDLLDTIKIFINKHIKELNNNDNDLSIANDKDNEDDNANDNDNDNESTGNVSCSVRTTYRTPYGNKEDRKIENINYKSLLTNNIKVLESTSWNDLDCDTKNEIFSLLNKTKNIEESSTKELFTKLNKLVNLALFHDENGVDKNGEDCLPF